MLRQEISRLFVPSSDHEIALVGARGKRQGILLLAGTGSAAFGIDATGTWHQLGGWGYLLGDEGSGYWIGLQALKSIVLDEDGMLCTPSALPGIMRETLDFSSRRDIIDWIYGADRPDNATIARFAPIVLQLADEGDEYARQIVEQVVAYFVKLSGQLLKHLDVKADEIAFAGGLLAEENVLSNLLAIRLKLPGYPITRHSPVIGAALLAKIALIG